MWLMAVACRVARAAPETSISQSRRALTNLPKLCKRCLYETTRILSNYIVSVYKREEQKACIPVGTQASRFLATDREPGRSIQFARTYLTVSLNSRPGRNFGT